MKNQQIIFLITTYLFNINPIFGQTDFAPLFPFLISYDASGLRKFTGLGTIFCNFLFPKCNFRSIFNHLIRFLSKTQVITNNQYLKRNSS